MIKFLNLNIKGFCSIQELSIYLNKPGINLIKGENGAGKSTLLNAISWIVYGKTLKGVKGVNTHKKFQPKEYKGTLGEIFFDKEGSVHQIIRCQSYTSKVEGAKGGDRLIYKVDGELVDEKKKPKIQELIEKDLGLSFKLFKNSITFGQRLQRLAEVSGTDKKLLFEEAFEIGYLSVAKQLVMESKKKYESEYKIVSLRCQNLQKEIESTGKVYKELRESERDYRKLQKERIQSLERKIQNQKDRLEKLDFDEKLLTKRIKKLDQLKNRMSVLKKDESKFYNQTSQISSKKGVIQLLDTVINLMGNKEYIKAYSHLISLKGSFISLDKIRESKSSLQEQIDSIQLFCSKNKEKRNEITQILNQISSFEKEVDKIKKEKKKIVSPKYREKQKTYKKKLDKLIKESEDLKVLVDNYNWLVIDPLSNSGIKTFIIDTSLQYLNKALASYQDIVGFKVYFSINEESARRDFITFIERDGQLFEYEELSGGEQQLVNIIMAFALHQTTSASLGVNVLFLDELFENLDKGNIEIVMDLVKSMANEKSIYLITHQSNFSISGANVIHVLKEHGITTIKE